MSDQLFDIYGRYRIDSDQLADMLYKNPAMDLTGLEIVDPDQYNTSVRSFHLDYPLLKSLELKDISIENFDKENQQIWFMPDEYKKMDIEGFLINKCPKENYQRLHQEIVLFRERNMLNLLRYLKYLVDTMTANDILWGVGRGSSVSSYALYLMGVHKIDSIKYKLDINEFLK
jgi:DNA polymerase III alpha subunit